MPENIEDPVLETAPEEPKTQTLDQFFASAGAVEVPDATRQILERAARTRVQEQRRGRP